MFRRQLLKAAMAGASALLAARRSVAATQNSSHSIFARGVKQGSMGWQDANRAAQAAIARQVGCQSDEVAVTRSGADALQMLITNYRNLKPATPSFTATWTTT
jgi:selenocysteine lyase/cysteine desulfurase